MLNIGMLYDRNADFIEYQYKAFKNFIKNDFTLTIFNNAKDDEWRSDINRTCKKLNINTIDLPGLRMYEAQNIMWNQYIKNLGGLYFYLDSDMFIIDYLDIEKISLNYEIMYVPSYRDNFNLKYIWPDIFYLNLDKVDKDIDWSIVQWKSGFTDDGGGTYKFLNKKDYKTLYMNFYCLEDIKNEIMETNLNGCSGRINFTENDFYLEYHISFCDDYLPHWKEIKKIFPHEKEDENYMINYRKSYDFHKMIAKKYSFPRPYEFDLMKICDAENYFVFHYKRGSWGYGDGNNQMSYDKKKATKLMMEDLVS